MTIKKPYTTPALGAFAVLHLRSDRETIPTMRHVIVWSLDRSSFHLYGSYQDFADGKVLLYQAKHEYPGHEIERLTDHALDRIS
jgi:hypothetical protein